MSVFEPGAANAGIVRPPIVYLSAIALGLMLHLVWPAQVASSPVILFVGVAITLLGLALFTAAVRTLRAAGSPVPGNQPTIRIVRTGPYGFCRNPIYLAFSLFQFGLSLWINSAALLIMLLPPLALMQFVVIPREERYLEMRFAREYLQYKASVHRWF